MLHREFVPPTFKEVRHVFNLATIKSVAPVLKMISFDADDTIYEDGGETGLLCPVLCSALGLRNDALWRCVGIINHGSTMVDIVFHLMRLGVTVSIVTAAGYPGEVTSTNLLRVSSRVVSCRLVSSCVVLCRLVSSRDVSCRVVSAVSCRGCFNLSTVTLADSRLQPSKYETRLRGFLDAFQFALDMGASMDLMSRFYVMGGECNYLLRTGLDGDHKVRLIPVPGETWKDGRFVRYGVLHLRIHGCV